MKSAPHFRISESCLLWTFGDTLSEQHICQTLGIFQILEKDPEVAELGVTDLVPAYTSLAVHFQGAETRAEEIIKKVHEKILSAIPTDDAFGTQHQLPVIYDGEDLNVIASHCNLSSEEVILRHSTPNYLVAMIGFQPNFPYLFGLDEKLAVPRRETPRIRVPAGAVAIGGTQTGVYPSESPGGWNLIGRTDPARLTALRPGDRVQFIVRHES